MDHFGDLLQIGAALARFSGASSLSAFARFPILLRPTSDATPQYDSQQDQHSAGQDEFLADGHFRFHFIVLTP